MGVKERLDAGEYLEQAFMIDRLIKAKVTQIQELRDMCESLGGIRTDTKVQTSLKLDPLGDAVTSMMDSILYEEKEIARLIDVKKEIAAVISSVERDDYRLILYERYVNMKKWEEIAVDSGYSERHVKRLHGMALKKICPFMSRKNFV